jgi:phosphatidylserine decarboxylase
MSIAKEGFPYIAGTFILAVLSFVLGFNIVGAVLVFLALFIVFFFRDPERSFQITEGQVLSPADGKVLSVRREGDREALSIFLSIFDVHVNRAPTAGKITNIDYHRGKFLIAYDERASAENERNSITIDHSGKTVRFVQIAGLVARRIVCWKHEGDSINAGERVGLIKFGSRVDVFLPAGSKIQVRVGERVKAGATVIGELS